MKNKEKGITLIALVITVLLLVILAAITIRIITKHNILNEAEKAGIDYLNEQDKESGGLQTMADKLKDIREEGLKGKNPGDISGDNGGSTEKQEQIINISSIMENKGNEIGKYVNYKQTSSSCTIATDLTGTGTTQSLSTDNSVEWRIWNIDKENLYLISDRPANQLQIGATNRIAKYGTRIRLCM